MQKLNKIKIEAEDLFLQRKYRESISKYMSILSKEPNDKDAKIGIILNDMAFEREEESQALFDYYLILRKKEPINAPDIVEEIIHNFDENFQKITSGVIEASKSIEQNLSNINGISYKEFKDLLKKSKNNFKEVFESIMFSTKIIIVGKDEFMEFLNLLVENQYDEMALNYIEGAVDVFKGDLEISALCDKLSERRLES